MNGKTFAVIYLLIILTGFLSVVAVLEYHTTSVKYYVGVVEVFQQDNEYKATTNNYTEVMDLYLFKTEHIYSRVDSITIAHGSNASQVIQAALDQLGIIFFHAGVYNMTSQVWIGNNTTLIGDVFWSAKFTKDKFYVPNGYGFE